jgi:DNA-binding beta-propeller fold protein YncE
MLRAVPRLALALMGASFLAGCQRELPSTPASAAASATTAGGVGGSEVWVVDQSNSAAGYGGRIHIFATEDLMGAAAPSATPTDVVDLAAATAALCMSTTGANPVRPHMLFFNTEHSHAVLAFVASGHVVVFDAATRRPVTCQRASAGAGGARQAHAAVPSPDGSYILVANQNGKLLERIDSDYATNTFTLDPAATIDLATCTTASGTPCQSPALRPDNAPICPVVGSRSNTAWVTLRGGGLLVVDPTQTPMRIVGDYDRATVHPNGCGGQEAAGHMYLNSGGGTGANMHEFDVYQFPLTGYAASNSPNAPAPRVIYSDDVEPRESHGTALAGGALWAFDRGANLAEVFDAASGAHLRTVSLLGGPSSDPTPDLADVSPSGNRIFVTLRGPNPLTADPHVSTGSTPGVGVIRLEAGGTSGGSWPSRASATWTPTAWSEPTRTASGCAAADAPARRAGAARGGRRPAPPRAQRSARRRAVTSTWSSSGAGSRSQPHAPVRLRRHRGRHGAVGQHPPGRQHHRVGRAAEAPVPHQLVPDQPVARRVGVRLRHAEPDRRAGLHAGKRNTTTSVSAVASGTSSPARRIASAPRTTSCASGAPVSRLRAEGSSRCSRRAPR